MLLLRALQCCRHLRDDVGVETRPKPVIRDPTDAIIRVKLAGICGRWASGMISCEERIADKLQ